MYGPSVSSSGPKTTQPEYVSKVFNKDAVTDINISIKQEDWDWLLENATQEQYVSCDITINGQTFSSVGIRAKGNSSLSMVARDDTTDRFSFKIDFNEYVKGQSCFGLDKLALNNIMADKTYMKEYMSYWLFDEMGVSAPAYAYSNITVNGEDWGLYLAVEVIEESFVERYYGSTEGNLYKPESMEMGGMPGGQQGGNQIPQGNNADQGDDRQMPGMNWQQGGNVQGRGGAGGQQQGGNQIPQGNNAGQGGGRQMPGMNGQQDGNQVRQDNNAGQEGNLQMPGGNARQGGNVPGGQQQGGNQARQDNNAGQGGNQQMPGADGQQEGNMQARKGAGGMGRSSGGTNLVYNGDDASNYSAVLNSAVLKTTDESDYQKVIDMIKNLNAGTDIEKYIDVDEVLRYFAVNTFLVNLDSYAGSLKHNYYLYEENGIFQILPWDFNLSFAGHDMQNAQNAVNFPIDTPVSDTMENSPLIAKLLDVDEYKALYHEYLSKLVTEFIESGSFESTVSRVNTLINTYVKKDATAFYSYDEYQSSLPVLLQFSKDRAKSITAQLAGQQPSTSYGTLATTVDLKMLGSMGNGGGGMARPGDGQGGNMQGGGQFPGAGNMPGAEVMQQAMAIIQGAGGGELSDEQVAKLKELGLDTAMIEQFKNMAQGGMGQPDRNFGGNMQGGGNGQGQPGGQNVQNIQNAGNYASRLYTKDQLILLGISVIFLITGLVAVSRFQRRRYKTG